MLAQQLQQLGARVTLLLGPVNPCSLEKKIRLIRFKFFDEFQRIIEKELASEKQHIIIHSAAVSDYRPLKKYSGKFKSKKKAWRIDFIATPKIIDDIKKTGNPVFLVGFKFEPEAENNTLIKKARDLIVRSRADLVVANTVKGNKYKACIVNKDSVKGTFYNKIGLVNGLIHCIGAAL